MSPQTSHHGFAGNPGGFVLVFALLILVTLTFLGFMAVRTAVTENTLSGNERVQRETFSLADGGTEVATHMLQENIDCPTGFPRHLLAEGAGAIRFPVSAVFTDKDAERDYMSEPPPAVRASLPPNYDANAHPNPEILRQFCIGGEGLEGMVGIGGAAANAGNNGCNPLGPGAGAPHTNILYNPNPEGKGSRHVAGESANASGGGSGKGYSHTSGGTMTDVDIYSQHVAYHENSVTDREAIIRIRWAQPNNGVNNCRW